MFFGGGNVNRLPNGVGAFYVKTALHEGPIIMGFEVMQDFVAYKGGVYHPVVGVKAGMHAVMCFGYDGNALKCMNSWGRKWGEKGMFKIQLDCKGCQMNYWTSGTPDATQAFPLETSSSHLSDEEAYSESKSEARSESHEGAESHQVPNEDAYTGSKTWGRPNANMFIPLSKSNSLSPCPRPFTNKHNACLHQSCGGKEECALLARRTCENAEGCRAFTVVEGKSCRGKMTQVVLFNETEAAPAPHPGFTTHVLTATKSEDDNEYEMTE